MVVKTDTTDKIQYCLKRKAGRSIIERRPVFSSDGESLAVIVEDVVHVYNLQTCELVRILESQTPVDEFVGIEFPQNVDYNLYGCSKSGLVTVWTWDKGAVLRDTQLRIPLNLKVLTFDLINENECFITGCGGSFTKNLHYGTYSMKTGDRLCEYGVQNIWNTYKLVKVALGWNYDDRFAAISNGTKSLYIQSIYDSNKSAIFYNFSEYRIVSVACHKSVNALAITDTLGRVVVIRGNLFDVRNAAKEVFHWHCLPPMALCFSIQGNYLYSGGVESVLVKWTLGSLANKAAEKAFIPRLPGLVRYVTTNNTHIAITLSNNSIVIANAQMHAVGTIAECGGVSPSARTLEPILLHHGKMGALLMHGPTGHLQMYSTKANKVLYDIDITGTNRIQPERWNLMPLQTEITCASLSRNGQWLATSEYRNDGYMYPEEQLKFWVLHVNKQKSPFTMNTCINLSHNGCRVVALTFSYDGKLCVSSGLDQKFRLWEHDCSNSKVGVWVCLTACYYSSGVAQFLSQGVLNNFKVSHTEPTDDFSQFPYMKELRKDDPVKKLVNFHNEYTIKDDRMSAGTKTNSENEMGGVAISKDGSLIAAWFGCKLTLWDTYLCTLRTSLSHPALRPKGVDVLFGSHDAAHYLVCTTESCLAVWSILSLTVKWLVQLNPTALSSDLFSNRMAVVTSNNDIHVFTPHNSKPVLSEKRVADPNLGVFKKCTFGTPTKDNVTLYLLRNDVEIFTFEPEKEQNDRLEAVSHTNAPISKFSTLLAEQQLSAVREGTSVDTDVNDVSALSSAAIANISLAPPYMTPPMSLLCTTFLQELSGQEQPKDDEITNNDDVMDVDASSDEDEIKLNGPYAPRITELWTPNYEAVKEKKINRILEDPFVDLHSTSALFGI